MTEPYILTPEPAESKVAWVISPSGNRALVWRINGQEKLVVIHKVGDDAWKASWKTSKGVGCLDGELEQLISKIEVKALREAFGLVTKVAGWRTRPPSAAQLKAVGNKEIATAGEASDLMTARAARRLLAEIAKAAE
jgi:hypothetical protein